MRAPTDTAGASPDAALVAAARSGDRDAYAQLFERYHGRIYNYAYGIAGNPDDAGDIAQEAFVRMFQALPRLTGELNFSAYLYRTAHNAAMDAVKRRSRFAPPEALDLQMEPALRADPERVTLVQQQQEQAWTAAFELSDNHRAILTLRELHDLSYQEIADIMEMPRATVGVLLSRARLKFKEAFRMSSIDTENLVKECRDMLPLLSAYIDDELDATKRERVETHLEDCAFCRLALEEMTESSKSYRVIVPLLPAASAEAATWARLRDSLPSDSAGLPDVAITTGSGRTDEVPSAADRPAPRRLTSKVLAATLAVAAVVIFGVSVAGGLSELAAWRSTSTTTLESRIVASSEADPTSGALAVAASSTTDRTTTVTIESSTTTTEPSLPTTTKTGPASGGGASSSTGAPVTPSTTTSTTQKPADPGPSTTTTTRPQDTQPPPTPALLSPASGAVIDGGKVKLSWQAVKDPSGVAYRVEIQHFDGKSYAPLRTVDGLTATTLGHSMKSILERWRVTAIDGRGNASKPSAWWTISQPLTIVTPKTGLTLITPSSGLTLLTTTTIILY